MEGILVVDKPAGMSSHDVVARVRRLARTKKVGHAGTLDPLATGVLVLALGSATRLLEYLTNHDKQYLATVVLCVTTSTYDAEGEETSRYDGALPGRSAVEGRLDAFRGEISQVPPIYSAIKQEGEALYAKARRGEVVSVPPRLVTIYALDLLDYQPPRLELRVRCSKGTYIRSLAHDLGQALGTGAFLQALRREASGPFTLDQAQTLATLEQTAANGGGQHPSLPDLLLPPGTGLDGLPVVPVTPDQARALAHGRVIDAPRATSGAIGRALLDGHLVAFVEYDAPLAAWRPRKVLG
ncbi:MAG TPA: tRNA pseudouridine(55) synthase TruB [Ardenticatenaceae bacterium]|nr:tRNA pseudouridine(55) synthase TruB [Ardenticatenaceae bacterium]